MARTVIGIDVGTNAVRAAEVELRARPRLVRFGQVALPAGAVHEGEVADVDAVATALRRLWQEAGFRSRSVRVGLASARVIVRVLPLPAMSAAETRAALQFTLADYVPLPPGDTNFDVQRLPDLDAPNEDPDAPPGEATGRVLLAAAHREAVEQLLAAVRAAGLKVEAVDPLPAALVRALSSPAASSDGTHPVEAIVSVGAGTILVIVARAGVPLYARTITSLSGGLVTDRISAALDVPAEEAERLKRSLVVLPGPGSTRLEQARRTAGTALDEVLDEVNDSLGYYGAQAGAQAVTRVILTGGGMLLPGLAERLAVRLGLPVRPADPFALVDLGSIGFDPFEMPRLVPLLPASIGVALGGGSKVARLDLRPVAMPRWTPSRPVIAAAAAGLVVVALASMTYVQRRGDLSAEQRAVDGAQADLAVATAAAAPSAAATADAGTDRAAVAGAAYATATAVDLDWAATAAELEALSAPLGVSFSTIAGTAQPPVAATIPPVTAATSVTTVAASATSVAGAATTAVAGAAATPGTEAPVTLVGQLTLNGTAVDRAAVASWLETVEASPRFAGVFVASLSTIESEGGPSTVEFSAQLQLTSISRVTRGVPAEVTP